MVVVGRFLIGVSYFFGWCGVDNSEHGLAPVDMTWLESLSEKCVNFSKVGQQKCVNFYNQLFLHATHGNYSFCNPKQHSMLAADGRRRIFFEGTYTSGFTGNYQQTAGCEYHQISYKWNLFDVRLNLPVVFYLA